MAEYRTVPLPPGIALEGGWGEVGRALIDGAGEPVLVVDLSQLAAATGRIGGLTAHSRISGTRRASVLT